MNKFFLIASILVTSLSCYSQNTWEAGVRFIPQATTFRYNQGISPLYDFLKVSAPYDFRIRTAQGIGVTYNPNRHMDLGADLMYSLQGGGYKKRKTNLDYLSLPFWLGYHASPKRKVMFTIQSGIEVSYLIAARMKYASGEKENIRSYVRELNWGIPFAIGVKFKAWSYLVTTQLYLYTDLSPIAKSNSTFGVYNYIYPGFRICIDQPISRFLRKTK